MNDAGADTVLPTELNQPTRYPAPPTSSAAANATIRVVFPRDECCGLLPKAPTAQRIAPIKNAATQATSAYGIRPSTRPLKVASPGRAVSVAPVNGLPPAGAGAGVSSGAASARIMDLL